jgi:tRNA threonylcarbamoyladenosine biosynthesis protein TsaE
MEIITKNTQGTKRQGKIFASSLKGGETIAFIGNLGSGKTTFVQGMGEYFGIKRIISPTFTIIRHYKTQNPKYNKQYTDFYHIDLYRLEKNLNSEIGNLGLSDIWNKKENIVAIEWAEKIKDLLPADTIYVKIENIGEDKRKITYEIIH